MKRDLVGCLSADRIVSLTNLCVNGNFATTASWTHTGASFSVAANIASWLANSAVDQFYQSPTLISGHVYYACGWLKAASGANVTTGLSDGVSANDGDAYNSGGNWQFWSARIVSTRNGAGQLWPAVDNRASGWNTINMKYITLIDLTAAFGAGNEPTEAQMNSIMPQLPESWVNGTQETTYYW
jgi:hypothetical protein